jgi:hypothetical protein
MFKLLFKSLLLIVILINCSLSIKLNDFDSKLNYNVKNDFDQEKVNVYNFYKNLKSF